MSKPADQVEYQSMVGSLIYVAMGTRTDIAQAVGAVSKFCRSSQSCSEEDTPLSEENDKSRTEILQR